MTETNAERLVLIMLYVEYAGNTKEYLKVKSNDVMWFIEQAERAQTLETSIQKAIEMQEYYLVKNDALEQDNKRLREALKEVAEETGTPYSKIARQALEGAPGD